MKVLEEKQASYDASQATLANATAKLDSLEQELNGIANSISQKQTEKENAQKTLDNLNAQIPTLNQIKQEAQAALDAVSTTGQGITSAREFYEWLGDTAQATRFDWDSKYIPGGGARLASFTNQGAKGDSTSIDNIKKEACRHSAPLCHE